MLLHHLLLLILLLLQLLLTHCGEISGMLRVKVQTLRGLVMGSLSIVGVKRWSPVLLVVHLLSHQHVIEVLLTGDCHSCS